MKHLRHILASGVLVAASSAVAQPAPPPGEAPGANRQPGKAAEMNRSQPGQPRTSPGPAVRPNGGAPQAQRAPKPAPHARPAPAPRPAPQARPAPVPPPKPRPQTPPPPPPPPKKGGFLHWLFG